LTWTRRFTGKYYLISKSRLETAMDLQTYVPLKGLLVTKNETPAGLSVTKYLIVNFTILESNPLSSPFALSPSYITRIYTMRLVQRNILQDLFSQTRASAVGYQWSSYSQIIFKPFPSSFRPLLMSECALDYIPASHHQIEYYLYKKQQ